MLFVYRKVHPSIKKGDEFKGEDGSAAIQLKRATHSSPKTAVFELNFDSKTIRSKFALRNWQKLADQLGGRQSRPI